MKKVTILAALVAVLVPLTALGQPILLNPADFNPEPNNLWVSFTPEGDAPGINVGPFMPFDFFAVVADVNGSMFAYEFALSVPAQITIVQEDIYPVPGAFNGAAGARNYLVGTGGICMPDAITDRGTNFHSLDPTVDDGLGNGLVRSVGGHTVTALVHLQGLIFAPASDLAILITEASPTSFAPPSPGYLTCVAQGDLRPFQPGLSNANSFGFAVVNPVTLQVPVPNEASSWGAVKAGFSN